MKKEKTLWRKKNYKGKKIYQKKIQYQMSFYIAIICICTRKVQIL